MSDFVGLEQPVSKSSLAESLVRLAGDDPRVTQIAQLLTLRKQQESGGEELVHLQEELAQALVREEELRSKVIVLQRCAEDVAIEAKRIKDAYEVEANRRRCLENVVERIGKGLGACPACLGQEESGPCELCHNRVGPGTMPPLPENFEQLVLPAVRAHLFYTRSRSRRDRLPQRNES